MTAFWVELFKKYVFAIVEWDRYAFVLFKCFNVDFSVELWPVELALSIEFNV